MIIKNKIINLNDIQVIEGIEVTRGKEVIKGYFNFNPLAAEVLDNTFISYVNNKGLGKVLSICIKNHIELFINKNLQIIYSYIKTKDGWKELDKEQAQRELYRLYYTLGYNRIEQDKKKDLKSKYNLIGHLLKYKLYYKSFINWEIQDGYVKFNFINKQGYRRCWQTNKSNIKEYLSYNNNDILKVLFDLN